MKHKTILIVDDEQDILDILSVIIEGSYDNPLLLASSGNTAIKLLSEQASNIGLVICDFNMMDGKGDIVYKYMLDHALNIPYFFISTHDSSTNDILKNLLTDSKLNRIFPKPFQIENILDAIGECVLTNEADISSEKTNAESFIGIKNEHLNILKDNEIDFYVRLSEKKFVKVADVYDRDVIDSYINKGATEFFFQADELNCIVTASIENNFKEFLTKKHNNKNISLHVDSLFKINLLIQKLGINPKSQLLVDNIVANVMEDIPAADTLENLLKEFKNKENYIQEHALLTSYIAVSVASLKDWFNHVISQKIVIASLFQNISINDKSVALAYDLKDELTSALPLAIRTLIKDHPQLSLGLLGDLKTFENENDNNDILIMIKNHHCLPDNNGFLANLSEVKGKPWMIFYFFAVRFAHELLTRPDDSYSIVLQDLNEIFGHGEYTANFNFFLDAFKK